MKIAKIIFCALILSGCVSPKYNYETVLIEMSEPPINSINIAYVGDTLLRQGKYTEHDAVSIQSDIKVGLAYTIRQGYFLKQGFNKKSDFYTKSNESDSGEVSKAFLADEWKSLQVYKDKNTICVVSVFNSASCTKSDQYERVKKPVLSANSFQQTLIYSGRIGNKINISYREFSNDFARPAFNNDVEYDLSDSNYIGYKGAKIEIIEATNELIKYRVIRNFNLANR